MTDKHIGSNFDDFLKEEGIEINITLDDVINGNLQDMGITAQLAVYRQTVKSLAKEVKSLKDENKKLKKERRETIKHYDNQLGAVIKRYNDLLKKTNM